MKCIGMFLSTGRKKVFDSIEAASAYTKIQKGYIRLCIMTGRKWRGWVFDMFDMVEDI